MGPTPASVYASPTTAISHLGVSLASCQSGYGANWAERSPRQLATAVRFCSPSVHCWSGKHPAIGRNSEHIDRPRATTAVIPPCRRGALVLRTGRCTRPASDFCYSTQVYSPEHTYSDTSAVSPATLRPPASVLGPYWHVADGWIRIGIQHNTVQYSVLDSTRTPLDVTRSLFHQMRAVC